MVSPRGRRRGPDCAAAALWLAAILAAGGSVGAQAPARDPWPPGDGVHRSHIVVPPLTRFPLTRKITIGVDKSMLIELPVDLQNVLVSNPEILDAVVQSSRRVYRLAKDVGDASAFFLGADGQKLVFLEVTVARDLTALSDALARLIPGSQIKAESVGDNVVLAGSVITPIDANRAAELAGRYTKKRDAVVNMLAVGTKEQVLLRVQVAEMQRDAIRRIGVNLPEAILKGNNITFTKVMQNALPVTSQSVIGAISGGAGSVPFVVGGEAAQLTWTNGANSITAFIQALERAGLVRTLAEPNLTAISGEKAEFQAGGRVSGAGLQRRSPSLGELEELRRQPLVHAGGAVAGSDQPQRFGRGQRIDLRWRGDAQRHRLPRAQGANAPKPRWNCRAAAPWGDGGPHLRRHAPVLGRRARHQEHPRPRRLVSQQRLSAQGERARHARDALLGHTRGQGGLCPPGQPHLRRARPSAARALRGRLRLYCRISGRGG